MTDKCTYCDKTEGLEWHHIWPLSLGGPDEPYNLIRVCHDHHAILHEMSERTNISALTEAGLQRTREKGTILGPPLSITPTALRNMVADRENGATYASLADKYECPLPTLHRTIRKHADTLDAYEQLYILQQKQYSTPRLQPS